jgi:protein-S-isoprenylcysteine O-methyltransferase Ste14
MGFAWKFGFWFSSWASIVLVGYFSPEIVQWGAARYLLIAIGIALIIYGLLLNSIAGRTLKKYGHFDIKKGIKKPDKLVTDGIYSCMRHPAQFGSILFGIGVSLLTVKLLAILYAGWISFLALYFILAVEERETIAEFGEEYCEFLKERRPFSFSFKCLKKALKYLKKSP